MHPTLYAAVESQDLRYTPYGKALLTAAWSLVVSLACLGVAVNAAGVLEIDIVFPRNDTYAPTDNLDFPIVIAIQNSALAKNLDMDIDWFVRNGSNLGGSFGHSIHHLVHSNLSSDPYFLYKDPRMDTEGRHLLFVSVYWAGCNESDWGSVNFGVDFTIKKGAQQVDLVAATADSKTCSAGNGVAIGVTDDIREYPAAGDKDAVTCAVLASTSPTPTVDACRVEIDSAAAESMSAVLREALCRGLNPPANCPKENAVQQVVAVVVATFATALGAIGFLLG